MSNERPLADLRFLMFVADDYEDLELWYPRLRIMEAGGHVTVAGPKGETIYRGKHGYPCRSDAAIELMEAEDFQGVVIPGGFMPDKLRRGRAYARPPQSIFARTDRSTTNTWWSL